jgi:hypothetical protein
MLTFIDKKQLLPQEQYKADNLTTTTMNIIKELKFLIMENVTKFLSHEDSTRILSVYFYLFIVMTMKLT